MYSACLISYTHSSFFPSGCFYGGTCYPDGGDGLATVAAGFGSTAVGLGLGSTVGTGAFFGSLTGAVGAAFGSGVTFGAGVTFGVVTVAAGYEG